MAKKKIASQQIDVSTRLKNVRMLYNSNRIKESIAYLYVCYTGLANEKLGQAKTYSQTIRDYAIILVKKFNQDPQKIYPFIQQVERVVYGGFPASKEYFQEVTQNFGKLYVDLTGSSMPSF
jgi:hypothetical protein